MQRGRSHGIITSCSHSNVVKCQAPLFFKWDFAERLPINLSQVLLLVITWPWIQECLKWLLMPWHNPSGGPYIACIINSYCVCNVGSLAHVQISRMVGVQKVKYMQDCTLSCMDQSCRPADWDLPLTGSTILSLRCLCHHTSIFSPDLQSCFQHPCFPLWDHIQY